MVIAMRTKLVRLLVRRHVLPERLLALRVSDDSSPVPPCRGRSYPQSYDPSETHTFLHRKAISVVLRNGWSSFSAWHCGHCGQRRTHSAPLLAHPPSGSVGDAHAHQLTSKNFLQHGARIATWALRMCLLCVSEQGLVRDERHLPAHHMLGWCLARCCVE